MVRSINEDIGNIHLSGDGIKSNRILSAIVSEVSCLLHGYNGEIGAAYVPHDKTGHAESPYMTVFQKLPEEKLTELLLLGYLDHIEHFSDISLSSYVVSSKSHQDAMKTIHDVRPQRPAGVGTVSFVLLRAIKDDTHWGSLGCRIQSYLMSYVVRLASLLDPILKLLLRNLSGEASVKKIYKLLLLDSSPVRLPV